MPRRGRRESLSRAAPASLRQCFMLSQEQPISWWSTPARPESWARCDACVENRTNGSLSRVVGEWWLSRACPVFLPLSASVLLNASKLCARAFRLSGLELQKLRYSGAKALSSIAAILPATALSHKKHHSQTSHPQPQPKLKEQEQCTSSSDSAPRPRRSQHWQHNGCANRSPCSTT